mmetsp:Transcript_43516/g.102220  ORF Transcript_43516/g.102220 Transcript_43516/m.102220 type:complete len:227 (+) Transcript_43516:30-710(+)
MPKKKGKKQESSGSEDDGSDDEVGEAGEGVANLNLDPKYPLQVTYCGACSSPPEFCPWMGTKAGKATDECKAWAFANVPELAAKLGYEPPEAAATPAGGEGAAGGEAGAAGGEAAKPMPGGKTKKEATKEVHVSSKQRQKRKFVCTVRGLELFGIKLADACKIFKKKFSTGASVTETPDNKEEIEIQGDVKDDVVPLIVKEFAIPIANIFYIEGTGPKATKVPAGG